MSIVLVSDIFGITPALLAISKKLGACSIVDPYNGQKMEFDSEADAYSYFIENVGLDRYFSTLLTTATSIDEQTTLIGFSVGAAVIWRLSERKDMTQIKQAFCFYGSQIRNFSQVEPCFKVKLLFPKSEEHFDVVSLQKTLNKKANVEAIKVDYLHGFMNYHSNNYNQLGYNKYIDYLYQTARY